MAIKYGVIAALVALGVFAYAKRDFVLDAFDWKAEAQTLAIPAFDPAATAKALASEPPSAGAVRVSDAADSRRAALRGVPAQPPSTAVALEGGNATLAGTVVGPSGPVAGATVRLERFVDTGSGALDLTTNGSGEFALPNALGGRYRVRAWQSPGLAQLRSEVTFVADGEQRRFALELAAPSGRDVAIEWSNGGWVLGGTPSISVAVTQPYVNQDGQVALTGSPGLPVTVSAGGALAGGGGAVTGPGGTVSVGLVCASIGSTSATVSVGSYSRSLDLPSCSPPPTAPPPPPTTSPPTTAPPAGTTPGGTTPGGTTPDGTAPGSPSPPPTAAPTPPAPGPGT